MTTEVRCIRCSDPVPEGGSIKLEFVYPEFWRGKLFAFICDQCDNELGLSRSVVEMLSKPLSTDSLASHLEGQ